jgi:dihydrofolate reductase
MGGGELAREFLKADLIDEVSLSIVPILLGGGIPLFPSCFPQREFVLIENNAFPSGLCSLKCQRVRR